MKRYVILSVCVDPHTSDDYIKDIIDTTLQYNGSEIVTCAQVERVISADDVVVTLQHGRIY